MSDDFAVVRSIIEAIGGSKNQSFDSHATALKVYLAHWHQHAGECLRKLGCAMRQLYACGGISAPGQAAPGVLQRPNQGLLMGQVESSVPQDLPPRMQPRQLPNLQAGFQPHAVPVRGQDAMKIDWDDWKSWAVGSEGVM